MKPGATPVSAPYESIACFIDRDDASMAALAEARRLSEFGTGRLRLVHVAPDPILMATGPYGLVAAPEDVYRDAERWLREQAAEIPGAQPVLLRGYPPAAACDYAAEAGIDLIVLAAHRGLVRRVMLGGFAAYVAYRAPCPVLVVRPREAAQAGGEPRQDEAPGSAGQGGAARR